MAAGRFIVGSAWVKLRADSTGLRTDIRSSVTRAAAGVNARVGISVASAGLRSKLRQQVTQAARGINAKVGLEVDKSALSRQRFTQKIKVETDSDIAGRAAGGLFGRFFANAFVSSPAMLSAMRTGVPGVLASPAGLAGAAVAAVFVGSFVSAIISSAALGGIGALFTGLGVLLVKDAPAVQKKWKAVSKEIGDGLKEAAKPFVPAVVESLDIMANIFTKDIKPLLADIFTGLAPVLPEATRVLGEAMVVFLREIAKPEVIAAIRLFMIEALPELARLAPVLADFFVKMANNGPVISEAFSGLIDIFINLVNVFGDIILIGTATFNMFIRVGDFIRESWLWNFVQPGGLFRAAIQGIVQQWGNLTGFLSEQWGHVSAGVSRSWNTSWATITGAWHAFRTFIGEAWGAFAVWVSGIWTSITGGVSGSWTRLWNRARGAWNAFAGFISGAWAVFAEMVSAIWRAIFSVIRGPWNSMWNVMRNAWRAFAGFANEQWNAFTGFAATIWRGVRGVVSGAWRGMWGALRNGWNLFFGFISTVWGLFTEGARATWGVIRNVVSGAWRGAWNAARTAWHAFSGFVSAVWSAFTERARAVWGAIRNVVSSAWRALWSTARSNWNAFRGFIGDAWNSMLDFARGLWNRIRSTVTSIWSALFRAARAVWNAWASFMRGAWSAFANHARNVWNGVKAIVSNAWSTLWNTARRIWNSFSSFITSRFNSTRSTLQRIWKGMTDFLGDKWRSLWSGVKKVWNGIRGLFTSTIPGVFRGLRDSIAKIWKAIPDKIRAPIDAVRKVFLSLVNKLEDIPGVGGIFKTAKRVLSSVIRLPKFASGGRVQGPGTPIWDSIPALLSNDEWVINARASAKAQRIYGQGAMDHFNKFGVMPGHAHRLATGGSISEIIQYARKSGQPLNITSTSRNTNDYHGQNMAVDFGGFNQHKLAQHFMQKGSNLLELIHSIGSGGYFVKNGKSVSPGFYGGEVANHFNHVHVAAPPGFSTKKSVPLPGGGSFLTKTWKALAEKVWGGMKGGFNKLLAPLNKVPFGPAAANIMKSIPARIFAHLDKKDPGHAGGLVGASGPVMKQALAQAQSMKATRKVLLALFEAGFVESNFRNLGHQGAANDHDSLGFLQQRPSSGWGTPSQIMNVPYATRSFVRRAMPIQGRYPTAGRLAQAVQVSAFPARYDAAEGRARQALRSLGVAGFNLGGRVGGTGNADIQPALLSPGERVLTAGENQRLEALAKARSGTGLTVQGDLHITIPAKDVQEMKDVAEFFEKLETQVRTGLRKGIDR